MFQHAQDLMQRESPFGQSAVNVRTENIDIRSQGQKEQLHQSLLNRGFQPGSPQYNKAMQEMEFNANRERSQVIQQMAESDAQFGLQKSEMLRNYHDSFANYDLQNRRLIMQGQQMQRQAAAAAAAAASANARWKMAMQMRVAGAEFAAGRQVDKDMWNRYMQGASFDFQKSKWGKEFEYTKNYNAQALNLQRDLANQAASQKKKGGLLGFLGKVAGGIIGGIPGVGGVIQSVFGGGSGGQQQAAAAQGTAVQPLPLPNWGGGI